MARRAAAAMVARSRVDEVALVVVAKEAVAGAAGTAMVTAEGVGEAVGSPWVVGGMAAEVVMVGEAAATAVKAADLEAEAVGAAMAADAVMGVRYSRAARI